MMWDLLHRARGFRVTKRMHCISRHYADAFGGGVRPCNMPSLTDLYLG